MARFLSVLYWKSWRSGLFPKSLKKAFIVGIFKSGEKFLSKNYLPISLTSYFIKVLERVVRVDIIEFMNRNNLWDPCQHGSRSGRSTLSQIISHQEEIIKALEEG